MNLILVQVVHRTVLNYDDPYIFIPFLWILLYLISLLLILFNKNLTFTNRLLAFFASTIIPFIGSIFVIILIAKKSLNNDSL